MKTVIYYFSGTGNSLQVSRDLATYLNDTKIYPMTGHAGNEEIVHTDTRVGIVFPVYCWGLPQLVCEFVSRLRVEDDCSIFSVATCGGSIGRANAQLDEILRSLGMKLSSGFSVKMPGNYIPLYQAKKADQIKKILAAARAKVRDIAKVLNRNEERPYENGSIFSRGVSRVLYRGFINGLHKAAQKYHVNDKCVSCGTCVSVCPSKTISLPHPKEPPQWEGHCEQCMACIQWCPEEAIEYGKRTAGRRRYHYPGVRAEDIYPEPPPSPRKERMSQKDAISSHEAKRSARKMMKSKGSRGEMPQTRSAAKATKATKTSKPVKSAKTAKPVKSAKTAKPVKTVKSAKTAKTAKSVKSKWKR